MGYEEQYEMNTLLGKGTDFEGKLTFEGKVQIDGKFAGEIFADDTLIIGESADVKAEIDVANVIIYGRVTGNIRAVESIELHPPAQLRGNITTSSLVIEKGVQFDGKCEMDISQKGGESTQSVAKLSNDPQEKAIIPPARGE